MEPSILSPLRIAGGIMLVGNMLFYGIMIPYATRYRKIKRETMDTPRTNTSNTDEAEEQPSSNHHQQSPDDIEKTMLQNLRSPSAVSSRTVSSLFFSSLHEEEQQPSDEEIGAVPMQLYEIDEKCSSNFSSDERKQSPTPWCGIDWDNLMLTTKTSTPT